MQISFKKRRLQKTCESQQSLQKAHGVGCAKKISSRLADLEAVSTLDGMHHLPGGCHELEADRDGELALRLPDGKRLIFRPVADPAPTKPDGGLDWNAVDEIEVLEIVDYHD